MLDSKALLAEAAGHAQTLVGIRRELHQIPEFALDLPKTQARILESIEGLGEITLGKDLTSIALVIRGGKPGPTILLRADMDALRRLDARIQKYYDKLKNTDEISYHLYLVERANYAASKGKSKKHIQQLLEDVIPHLQDMELINKIKNQLETYVWKGVRP